MLTLLSLTEEPPLGWASAASAMAKGHEGQTLVWHRSARQKSFSWLCEGGVLPLFLRYCYWNAGGGQWLGSLELERCAARRYLQVRVDGREVKQWDHMSDAGVAPELAGSGRATGRFSGFGYASRYIARPRARLLPRYWVLMALSVQCYSGL